MTLNATVTYCKPTEGTLKETYKVDHPVKEPNWDLVKQYLPLLKSIVGRMALHFPSNYSRDDMYGVGLSGLIAAAQNFDPHCNDSFVAYAAIRIRGNLLDELRRIDWLPRSARLRVKLFRQAVSDLEQTLKRPATEQEICQKLQIDLESYKKLQNLSQPIVFLPLDIGCSVDGDGNDENHSLQEILADLTESNSREILEKEELIVLIKEKLKELPKPTQKLLALYYLEDFRLSEIAKVFGVTESRICQIHTEAINRLRKKIIAELKH